MFELDDIVIVKPGFREPVLSEPKVGVIVSVVSTNEHHPEWDVYEVLTDVELIQVPARRLIKAKEFPGKLVQNQSLIRYITNVTFTHHRRSDVKNQR